MPEVDVPRVTNQKSVMKSAFFSPFLVANLFAGTAPIDTESLEAGDSPPASSGDFLNSLFSGEQRLDLNHEFLHHDDVAVNRSNLSYRQSRENWSLEANLGFTDIGIDYTDAVGATRASERTEESWSGGLTLSLTLSESLSTTLGVTAYEGFADYQSVWISEYYDQFIGIPFASSYEAASPRGIGFQTGLVWDDPYGLGRISTTFALSEDDIVPAWSPALSGGPSPTLIAEPTIDSLTTYSGVLTWEKALNPTLKSHLTLRYVDITARDPRIQMNNQWAWSINHDFTLRAHLGGAREGNDFEALYGGIALHYDISPQWSVSLSGRLYQDTGEIVAAGFNTAAPELNSSEISASLAWSGRNTTIRLGVGLYETNFDEPDENNRFFADLYADREFVLGRLALSRTF
ncbi:MAG: hypothetical protein ACJAVK_003177 [Akkermansiaceae bacterium]|jgi:hypothetical protein